METTLTGLTPRRIVAELDRYIVGQAKAKRAIAIAMRNRFRREQLGGEMRGEIIPKNILMIGRRVSARRRSRAASPRSRAHPS